MATIKDASGAFFCTNNYGDGIFYYSPTGNQQDARPIPTTEVATLESQARLVWRNNGSILTYSKGQQLPFLIESEVAPSKSLLRKRLLMILGNYLIAPLATVGALMGFNLGLFGLLLTSGIALCVVSPQFYVIRNYNKDLLQLASTSSTPLSPDEMSTIQKKSRSKAWAVSLSIGVVLSVAGIMLLGVSR